jgi:hypothetical protein
MTASCWRSKATSRRARSASSALRALDGDDGLFRRYLFDSQSGMWIFRRDALPGFQPTADDGARRDQDSRVHEPEDPLPRMPIYYGERVGESKLNLWRTASATVPALQAPPDARPAPCRRDRADAPAPRSRSERAQIG